MRSPGAGLRRAPFRGGPNVALTSLRSERGVALVVALLVLVVISVLAVILMSSLNTDTKLVGHSVRHAQALNTAEAGVGEALARIRRGDVPNDGANPRMVSQIFLTIPGNVPVLGVDSTAMATAQPAGAWLTYSTSNKSPEALTIEHKTTPDRTQIYRYDPTANPRIQTAAGFPIFKITSTGRRGADKRRIITEVCQRPVTGNIKAAIAAEVGINFSGNSDVCGFNHSADTPSGDKIPACNNDHLGTGHLPASWSTGTISSGGSSNQDGSPVDNMGNQVGFYAGPWEALSMGQTEFFAWIGTPLTSGPSPPKGILYLDNNSVTQDQSGSFAYHGGNGEGLLYVDGDLTINGNFTFRGLIYIEGDLKINGTSWILGGMVVKGKTTIKIANGNCAILYSADAINQNIAKYGGQFLTLSWREGAD
jgi:Tfp pilus assembly protein PilX